MSDRWKPPSCDLAAIHNTAEPNPQYVLYPESFLGQKRKLEINYMLSTGDRTGSISETDTATTSLASTTSDDEQSQFVYPSLEAKHENNVESPRFDNRRKFTIYCRAPKHVILIICVVVCISLVSIAGGTIYLTGDPQDDKNDNKTAKLTSTPGNLKVIKYGHGILSHGESKNMNIPKGSIFVNSITDLQHLHAASSEQYQQLHYSRVVVTHLSEEFDDTSLTDFECDGVKSLEIVGPTTEAWLEFLLMNFKSLENLSIDARELCVARKMEDSQLTPLKLGHVKHLSVIRSLPNICPISSWIFNWRIPTLQSLTIQESDLTENVFAPVKRFLQNHRSTLEKITISKSYLCENCTFIDDVPYAKKFSFELLDQLLEPQIPEK